MRPARRSAIALRPRTLAGSLGPRLHETVEGRGGGDRTAAQSQTRAGSPGGVLTERQESTVATRAVAPLQSMRHHCGRAL